MYHNLSKNNKKIYDDLYAALSENNLYKKTEE